jgi:hypothetical protein
MAGGTVTITGGNVIHTFTSSGYLSPLTFVGNSLRFRRSAEAYLTRTFSTPTSQNTWTMSVWLKRGQLTDSYDFGPSAAGGNYQIFFDASGKISFYNASSYVFIATPAYRDPAAWYHIVLAVNSGASGSNKVRLYVNGSEVTAFDTDNRSSFSSSAINSAVAHSIGRYTDGSAVPRNTYDGEMTEYRWIDGQQLTPNSFGTFNSYGVWQPINYGGSYGTNGFYLPFTQSTSSTYGGSFNGSNQTLQIANSGVFNAPGTQNFTIEGWYYFNTFANPSSNLWGCSNGSGSTAKMNGYTDNTNNLHFDFTLAGGASVVTSNTTLSTGRWYHLAWVRNSGVFTIYINGVASGSTTSSINLTGLTQPFYIGYVGEAYGSTFNGYMSNFRYVLGTAVYTSNFTPPTTALK